MKAAWWFMVMLTSCIVTGVVPAEASHGSWQSLGVPPGVGQRFDSTPAAALDGTGRLFVFAKGADGNLYFNAQLMPSSDNWSGWMDAGSPQGMGVTNNPALIANADGRLEVFVRGSDGLLYHKWQLLSSISAAWSMWESLDAPTVFEPVRSWNGRQLWLANTSMIGNPALGRNADGRLQVFVRGRDNELYTRAQAVGGGWEPGWTHLGTTSALLGTPTTLLSDVTVAMNADGRLDVFGILSDYAVYHIAQAAPSGNFLSWWDIVAPPCGWLPQRQYPYQTAGEFRGAPAATRGVDSVIYVAVQGWDNRLWTAVQRAPNVTSGQDYLWAIVDVVMTTIQPAVISTSGVNHTLYRDGQLALQDVTKFLGGVLTTDPAVGVNADGRVSVFVRGTDDGLWVRSEGSPGNWAPPAVIGCFFC